MLTPDEKIAGREFKRAEQAKLDKLMEADPPTYECLAFHANVRHECELVGKEIALKLEERYIFSVAYLVKDGEAWSLEGVITSDPEQVGIKLIPHGRFGFIYKEGKCKCGATARSPEGHFVDAYKRPPIMRRVARQ